MAKTKAKAKNNNIIYIIIATAVVIVAIIIGIVIAKNNSGNNGDDGASQTSSLSASELANADITIEYGDYDKMEALSKDIQNGRATGKVVKIEGEVSHPMSTYSIVEPNEVGTGRIGTRFVIEGDETGYPEDGSRIIITGKVVELEPMIYVIKTLPDFIELQ